MMSEENDKPKSPRRQRKPSIRTIVKQAERTGKTVTSIVTPEGYTIRFGEAVKDDRVDNIDSNPWDRVLDHGAH
jgi:hypothetical protein